MRPTTVCLRSVWKGPFFVPLPAAPKDGSAVETMARASTILPSHVGRKFMVHNGKDFLPVLVSEQMVNHKLGEFAPTRKPFTFKKSDKKLR
ncbi:ribosomal protein S19/S15 [Rhizoclosmatium globosum]|uniref:Ribosomal protein S19/S15 n=1 Tax=Rhizoclosmatium globosum TaxID=329046 RepID=A0A1Y2CE96_9FUNG|nr:mitochondrial ribosomal small subunit component [Rhizoclosmatium sp. JEL0117]ORY45369.1 ribosomal protein S19/S15 [Rhizoclosmatium globosum]|eukprot:ORY45369.1 ribosomal protein S19/S15 [Rhizoclosmatium globosum]